MFIRAQSNNADRIGGSESVIVAAIVHVWRRIIIVTYFYMNGEYLRHQEVI